MKKVEEMNRQELIDEIKWITSIIDDQPSQACYLADLAEALGKKVWTE